MSTLLYPTDTDFSQDILNKCFQLEKRKDIFVSVENAIVKLGMTVPFSYFVMFNASLTIIIGHYRILGYP